MAYAYVKGIYSQNADMFSSICVSDIDSGRLEIFASEFGARAVPASELVAVSDMVLLAVKPAQIEMVISENQGLWRENQLLVSIAAGIKTRSMEVWLGKAVPVIRIMPNTPALVGEGMSALCKGAYAGSEHLEQVRAMCNCTGSAVIVEERYMDAVTAVSGSGPAYVFLFAEAMMDAAVHVGLSADIGRQLVIQTMKGSIKMLEEENVHPAVLKSQVCSPAGTTIAAIKQMEEGGLRGTVFNAIEKAYRRAIELGMD